MLPYSAADTHHHVCKRDGSLAMPGDGSRYTAGGREGQREQDQDGRKAEEARRAPEDRGLAIALR